MQLSVFDIYIKTVHHFLQVLFVKGDYVYTGLEITYRRFTMLSKTVFKSSMFVPILCHLARGFKDGHVFSLTV